MSTTMRNNTNTQNNVPGSLRRSTYYACIISCTFLAIVLSLFIYNHVKLSSADPQANKQIVQLVQRLAKSPKNMAIKEQIRRTDSTLRAEYFRRLAFADRGNYVLGFACVLVVLTASSVFAMKKNTSGISQEPADTTRFNNMATIGSAVVAVIVISFLSAQALNRPRDLSAEYSKVIAREKPRTSETAIIASSSSTQDANRTPDSTTAAQTQPTGITPPTPVLPAFPGIAGIVVKADKIPVKNASTSKPVETTVQPEPKAPALPPVVTVPYDESDYSPAPDDIAINWPMLRGPGGIGVITASDYPAKWNGAAAENLLWKTDIPLPGWNSPVVWGDKVFLTGASVDKRELYCFNGEDGKILWTKQLDFIDPAMKKPQIMEDTGYAPATCVTDGKRVFAAFPNGDLFCYDYEGNQLWKRSFGLPENMYGHASSLAMYKSILIVQFDQGNSADSGKSAIYGLQAKDGGIVWRTLRAVPNSWTTPAVINDGTSDIIVTIASPWMSAYAPLTGLELWKADVMSGDDAPSPAFADGVVYVTNMGSYTSAIKTGGTGDVTKTNVLWRTSENLPDISSPVASKGLLYMVTTDGILTCIDATNGKKHYEHPFDVTVNASPIMIGNQVYLLDSQGTMHIISATSVFTEESKGSVPDKTLATPAFAKGRIYIRGSKTLFCIGVKQ